MKIMKKVKKTFCDPERNSLDKDDDILDATNLIKKQKIYNNGWIHTENIAWVHEANNYTLSWP